MIKIKQISQHPLTIFISGIFLLGILYLSLLLQHKVPFGHDTFQYFCNQFFYYNEVVHNNTLPIWNPFLAEGLPQNYYFTAHLGLLSPVFYLLACLGLEYNYLYLFYLQIFFHEILLLGGVILLGRIYYHSSKAVWFTAFAATGSSIWFPQIWWNFHILYFIPMLFYCIHRALDTSHSKYLLAIPIISAAALIGTPLHITQFCLTCALPVYTLLVFLARKNDVISLLSHCSIRVWTTLTGILILIGIVLLSFFYGRNQISYNYATRENDLTVSASSFITYGHNINYSKFIAAFQRLPADPYNLDILFNEINTAGIRKALQMPWHSSQLILQLTGISKADTQRIPGASLLKKLNQLIHTKEFYKIMAQDYNPTQLDSTAQKILAATVTAPQELSEYHYARLNKSVLVALFPEHIAYTGRSADLSLYPGFIVFFFAAIALIFERRKIAVIILIVTALILLISTGSWLSTLFYSYYPFGKYLRHIGLIASLARIFLILYAGFGVDQFFSKQLYRQRKWLVFLLPLFFPFAGMNPPVLNASIFFWFISIPEQHILLSLPYVLAFLIICILCVSVITTKRRNPSQVFLLFILLLAVDLAAYRHNMISARMPSEDPAVINNFRPYPYSFQFQRQRQPVIETDSRNLSILKEVLSFDKTSESVAIYDTTKLLLYTDSLPAFNLREDYISRSILESEMQIQTSPTFPLIMENYYGIKNWKLLLFSHLNIASDPAALYRIMSLPQFSASILLTSATDLPVQPGIPNNVERKFVTVKDFTDTNELIPGQIKVNKFSANEIQINVNIPDPNIKNAWLYYSDAWNPYWRVYVNGTAAPLIRANSSFKAVPIPGGSSSVRFIFGDPVIWLSVYAGLFLVLLINAVFILLLWQGLRMPRPGKTPDLML